MNSANALRAVCGAILWAGLLAGLAPANAQQLEEIVVTAQYREENLQEVPVSVTAFTADQIAWAGITTTQDFVNLTPNMTMDDSFTLGNTFVQVRGVAQINNADSPVAIVIDGVPQNNQKQFKQELFDIERIEVLKGPQGSLYGRNAIGGAINIVSKAPSNETEGHIRLGAGNGGLVKGSGSVSGSIVDDKLLYRIAGAYKDFEGVTDNQFLGQEVDDYTTRDARGRLTWNVSNNFSVDARLSWSDADGGCCSDTFLLNTLIGNGPNPDGISNPDNNNFQEPSFNVRGETDLLESTDGTLKLTYNGDAGEFTYIANYTDLDERYFADLDFTDDVENSLGWFFTNFFFMGMPVAANQQQLLDVELFSHELRFTSPADQSLRWIAGVYYLQTDRRLQTIGGFDFAPTTPTFSRDDFAPAAFVALDEINDNDAWAAFGQLEYDIKDNLELTVGLRYDRDERNHVGLISGAPATTASETFSDVQPRLVLTQRWTEDALGYASYSRGFRSGGFNGPAVGSSQFEEETLDNFELGFKSTWNDTILVNGALFYGLSDNFQFFFVDLVTASQVISNIDEVDIMGVELELQALLSESWTVYGTVGMTDTEIEKSSARPQDEGNSTPKNQKFTFNVSTQYAWPMAGNFEGRFRVDYEHRGRKYWHPDNANPMNAFGLLDARIAFESDNIGFAVWGRNITDEEYWQDYNAAAFSGAFGDIGFLARGRTYGVDFEYRF